MVTLGVTVSGVCSSSSDTFLFDHHDLFMRSLHWHSKEQAEKVVGTATGTQKNDGVDTQEGQAMGAACQGKQGNET